METTLLKTFEAAGAASNVTLIFALLATVVGLAGTFLLLRKPAPRGQHNQRMLIAMLLFFTFLIGASTAFFSWMRTERLEPVMIYNNAVETSYGKVAYKDLGNAKIVTDQQNQPFSNLNQGTTRLLVILEKDGKTHALSEEDYPIEEVLRELRNAVQDWKKEQAKSKPSAE
ncbi:MAG: hypothetical protein RIC19_09305 [Phaeodactylibacter sp.]|uniref:hypothetical protein n=1 Tax=Phaeodactylibacter sp. TaxID=1940289 RepID=UPI0032F01117